MTHLGDNLKIGFKCAKFKKIAEVAELADARDSKSRDRKIMRVQFPLSAQEKNDWLGRFYFLQIIFTIELHPAAQESRLLLYRF